MRLCNSDCKTMIRCVRCDKQLCKLEDPQKDLVVQEHCSTEGFYNLNEGKVCIRCHAEATSKAATSRGYASPSSKAD